MSQNLRGPETLQNSVSIISVWTIAVQLLSLFRSATACGVSCSRQLVRSRHNTYTAVASFQQNLGGRPLPSLPLPLRSRPLNSASGSGGGAVKLLQRGLGLRGVEPQPKSNLVHFGLKIWHLVATILMIFLRINWPNFSSQSLSGHTTFTWKKSQNLRGPETFQPH